jgi:hypothetical protein
VGLTLPKSRISIFFIDADYANAVVFLPTDFDNRRRFPSGRECRDFRSTVVSWIET